MSVTFTVHNNISYCQGKGVCREEVYDCQCVDFNNGVPQAYCPECHGEGKVRFAVYPFELNMANDNFHTFASALGMDAEWCGEIDARKLEDLLRMLNPELAVRSNKEEIVENATIKVGGMELFKVHQAKIYECGLEREQIDRYVTVLFEICEEAIKRNELVVWG